MLPRIAATVLTATLLAAPLAAQEKQEDLIPAWPYRKIAWRAQLHKRLRELKLTLKLTNWTLERLLDDLSRSTRLTIRADKTLDIKATKVSLTVAKTRSLRWILDRLTRDKPYKWVLSEQDVVLTRMPSIYLPTDTEQIRRQIEDARFLPTIYANLRAVARRDASLMKAVATDRINHPALEMTGIDFLRGLSKRIGLPIAFQRRLATTRRVSLPAARRVALATFFKQTLGQLGLSWTAHRGKLWIGEPGFIKIQRSMARQSKELREEADKARAKILDKKLTLEVKGLRLHALGKELETALGLPVWIGPKAWVRKEKLTFSLKDRPLFELRKQLAKGVRLIVVEGAVYLVSSP